MKSIISTQSLVFSITLKSTQLTRSRKFFEKKGLIFLALGLSALSLSFFLFFHKKGLDLAYNDARSHLDIGRKVVDNLKPGLTQIGSVWLPLPHILMIPTIWNDFMWHSGLSGSFQSMLSFVVVGVIIYLYLGELDVGLAGRLFGSLVFCTNLNMLYMQSTAMTELLFLASSCLAFYFLLKWFKAGKLSFFIKSSFWVMISSLVRYDGWFSFLFIGFLIFSYILRQKGYRKAEGSGILFAVLGGLGIFLWFLWNLAVYHDPFYFAIGPYSAHSQQEEILKQGHLLTKGNLGLSALVYVLSLFYDTYTIVALLAILGAALFFLDKNISGKIKWATLALLSPLFFNILALFAGHAVLFVKDVFPYSWFNVRYGIILVPAVAIFCGYLFEKTVRYRKLLLGVFLFVSFFSYKNSDIATLDDAVYGLSGKDVEKASAWLKENVSETEGFVLISTAKHDALVFSSNIPLKRFIHEGTGKYWDAAVRSPDKWVKWIVMYTDDTSDLTFRSVRGSPGFSKFDLVGKYSSADIYQLKRIYWKDVITTPLLSKNLIK